jgi:hypothetical protein
MAWLYQGGSKPHPRVQAPATGASPLGPAIVAHPCMEMRRPLGCVSYLSS